MTLQQLTSTLAQIQALQEQLLLQKAQLAAAQAKRHEKKQTLEQQSDVLAASIWPQSDRTFISAELWQNQWQFAMRQTGQLEALQYQLQQLREETALCERQLNELHGKEQILADERQKVSAAVQIKVTDSQELQLNELARRR